MKITIFLFLFAFLVLNCGCASQRIDPVLKCNASTIDISPGINNMSYCAHCEIDIDILRKDFRITLPDTTYTIVGFRLGYDGNEKSYFEKDIFTDRVTNKNVDFLKKLKRGDFISIGCINISKGGQIFVLATDLLILVTKQNP